ncbi:MAG: hypothetical protein M1825_004963 [Sarcosagium campestre]|nr:MAG: hypothetical protein M1825_004963 [Sarcosagium campestre]
MTEVLSAHAHHDDNSYYSASKSSPSYIPEHPYTRTPLKPGQQHSVYSNPLPYSAASSAPSSPHSSQRDYLHSPAYSSSSPSSTLSLNSVCEREEEDDQIHFPSYDDVATGPSTEDLEQPLPPGPGDYNVEPPASTPAHTPSFTPSTNNTGLAVTAEDDTAVRDEPSRHVDYLSHDWREEDIWASWRHIVSKRKVYGNSARLENASWRTWTKAKYRLRTVSPETLNWLKDCDVTWLYGPLQPGSTKLLAPTATPSGSNLSKNNSFLNKKPILKKRSMSEIMLQRSISASSLLKQAAAAVQAQQGLSTSDRIVGRPGMGRAASDFVTSTYTSGSTSSDSTSAEPSASSSGVQTPGVFSRRHIHFNDKVEQCIAVDIKEGDYEYDDGASYSVIDDDESSDEGLVMMKTSSKAKLSNRNTPRNSFTNESKTIAILPSTTLKYRSDTPELEKADSKRSSSFWDTSKLSPSPSQETLRPSKASNNFLLDEDDEDITWQPSGTFGSPAGSGSGIGSGSSSQLSPQSEAGEEELARQGLRRTPSGMFMPYEEDEDDLVANGLFGKVVDTVNTARDIAHVIWNVGWRR